MRINLRIYLIGIVHLLNNLFVFNRPKVNYFLKWIRFLKNYLRKIQKSVFEISLIYQSWFAECLLCQWQIFIAAMAMAAWWNPQRWSGQNQILFELMRVYLAQRNIKDFSRRDSAASFFCFVFLSTQKDEEMFYNKILNLKKRNSKQLLTFKTNLFLWYCPKKCIKFYTLFETLPICQMIQYGYRICQVNYSKSQTRVSLSEKIKYYLARQRAVELSEFEVKHSMQTNFTLVNQR